MAAVAAAAEIDYETPLFDLHSLPWRSIKARFASTAYTAVPVEYLAVSATTIEYLAVSAMTILIMERVRFQITSKQTMPMACSARCRREGETCW